MNQKNSCDKKPGGVVNAGYAPENALELMDLH